MKQGWEIKKLGEVCDILNGYAFKSEKYTSEGVRVLRITNVQKGYVVDDDPKFYPKDEMANLQQYVLKENDLLMSLTGNVGRVGLLQNEMLPAALNQRVACLRIKNEQLYINYLFHFLNSDKFETDAIFSASGIAQKNMSTEWLKKYTIPVPSREEQERIVAELDCLSGVIEKKREQLKELDALAESIFYQMFGDPITNEKGWEVKKLSDAVSDDCPISYGIVQPMEDVEGGIPIVRPIDLVDTFVRKDNLKRTSVDISNAYKRTILRGDEILMCVRGTTGVVSMASDELKGCNTTRGIVPLFFDSVNRWFVYYLIKQPSMQCLIAENTYGIALKQINIKELRLLPIITPPLSFQQEFADKIEAIEKQKELIKQSITETEELFNSRMDYYFN